ncbi:hypothetical protein EPUL_001173, partial [Erysiphe pulchra]
MAIKPITGMLRRGLVLDLSIAFGTPWYFFWISLLVWSSYSERPETRSLLFETRGGESSECICI